MIGLPHVRSGRNPDMNMMVSDTRSLIRKNIEDEVAEVVRKEIESNINNQVRTAVRDEMIARRHRYSKKPPPPPNVTDIDSKRKA